MPDVFLSYSGADRAAAARIEQVLSAAGFSVFWDQNTPAGKDWNSWIGEKLAEAQVVVVLWSRESVKSRNVVHEATIAVDRGKLIPAMIEPLAPEDFPMGFYTLQAADLRTFSGGAEHPGAQALISAVAARLGRSGGESAGARPTPRPQVSPKRKSRGWIWLGAGAAALVAIGTFIVLRPLPQAQIPTGPPAPGAIEAAAMPGDLLLGSWRWDGVRCGDGPVVTREGDLLVFAMTGVPTFKHRVTFAQDAAVQTEVVEPADEAGARYDFKRSGDVLDLTQIGSGVLNTWQAC